MNRQKGLSNGLILSLVFLILFTVVLALWVVGSSLFPILYVPDQYLGETIRISRLVVTRPALLVIYDSALFPQASGVVASKYLEGSVVYGNFDVVVDDPQNLHPGSYIAVLNLDPEGAQEADYSVYPRVTHRVKDFIGRPQKITFTLK